MHSESPLYTEDFMAILKGLLFQVAGEGAGVHEERMDERRTLPLGPQPTSSSRLDQLQLEPFLVAKFPFCYVFPWPWPPSSLSLACSSVLRGFLVLGMRVPRRGSSPCPIPLGFTAVPVDCSHWAAAFSAGELL